MVVSASISRIGVLALRDPLLAGHEVARAVDRVDGEQLAARQVVERETARVGVAAHDRLVVTLRQPGDLQLDVVLVRPEPRHVRVARALAAHVGGGRLALLHGVVHRLEAHAALVPDARVIGAVARGVDVRVRRLALLVHPDAVLAADARGGGETDVRQDADPDDHEIRGKPFRAADDSAHATVALEGGYRSVAVDADALPLVPAHVEGGQLGRHHAVHGPVGHLEHRDFEPEMPRARGRFEPHVACPDHHEAPGARQVGPDCLDVGNRAQVVDAAQVVTGYVEHAWPAADAQQQLVVDQLAAVGEAQPPVAPVDRGDARTEPRLDPRLLVELRAAQQQPVALELARQELLRQRGPVVGQVGLVADQDDGTLVALAPQRIDGLDGGVAGADDDNGFTHSRFIYGRSPPRKESRAGRPVAMLGQPCRTTVGQEAPGALQTGAVSGVQTPGTARSPGSARFLHIGWSHLRRRMTKSSGARAL